MSSIKRSFYCVIILMLILSGCNIIQINNTSKITPPTISKHPPAADFSFRSIESLPKYDPDILKGWQVDVRSIDLTSFDLTNREYDLLNSCFDSKTKWPLKLPEGFNPANVLDTNKNPGLNIHKLHNEGITGKGVNIAIIDTALLVDHIEYSDRLKMYEEIHCLDERSQMHAPATASIAAGKTTGVAPEANLYFIGCSNFNPISGQGLEIDFTWDAKAIDRIIEVNKTLPQDKKIRVLSISAGWSPDMKGYNEMTAAVNRAVKEGIFVLSVNLFETYKNRFYFNGLDIDTLSDKDSVSSYNVIPWTKWIWEVQHMGKLNEYYEKKFDENAPEEILLVPIGSKTTASPTGNSDYVFYRDGGWSWIMPYMAGLYALSCQVKPDITPDVFWNTALKTGESKTIIRDDKKLAGKIVNPDKLIESLKSMK